MKPLVTAALFLFAAAPVLAQSQSNRPLDLKLHPDTAPASVSTAPGVYYGDTSGRRGDEDEQAQAPDPDAGKPTQIHGSVSTSIGYAKGFGTGVTNAAQLDISHRTDDNNRFDVHIGVANGHGFPAAGPWGYP
ncbi:hypothetical protein [Frateuria defendens]|uniref:hypothetical protein n=1 Tax=Frateuria defendens TaxID=2219559 RepID=UPI00066FD08B|nr:hypothetical protein [Frateuria defendens]